jgi:aldehyde dehydrogenase (NAD+)
VFFTGSSRVGKIIYEQAARNLIPCVLELGGKCPAIIDNSMHKNLDVVVRRLLWAAMANAGQFCIRPDYILIHKSVYAVFVKLLKQRLLETYGKDPEKSPWLSRIVNSSHFKRILNLIEDARDKEVDVFVGSRSHNEETRYIAPRLLSFGSDFDAFKKSALMQEEVFGPVLILAEVDSIETALDFINSKEKPLSAYLFSNSKKTQEIFLAKTISGGVVFNDCLLQNGNVYLPFGGVGGAGLGGRFQGQSGFEVFSNLRPILSRSTSLDLPFRYPPYSIKSQRIIRLMTSLAPSLEGLVRKASIRLLLEIVLFVALIYFILN